MSDITRLYDDTTRDAAARRAADRLDDMEMVRGHAENILNRFGPLAQQAGSALDLRDIERAERLASQLHVLASRLAMDVSAQATRKRLRRTEGR